MYKFHYLTPAALLSTLKCGASPEATIKEEKDPFYVYSFFYIFISPPMYTDQHHFQVPAVRQPLQL